MITVHCCLSISSNNLPPSDPSPAEEHLAAPYFFSAIVAPVLLILIAVESILIVMLRSQWIVHSIMLSIVSNIRVWCLKCMSAHNAVLVLYKWLLIP